MYDACKPEGLGCRWGVPLPNACLWDPATVYKSGFGEAFQGLQGFPLKGESTVCPRDAQWQSSPGELVGWRVGEAGHYSEGPNARSLVLSTTLGSTAPMDNLWWKRGKFPPNQSPLKGSTQGLLGRCAPARHT